MPAAVDFGPTAAASFTVDSPTQLTAVTSAHTAGTVDVKVTTAGGTSLTTSADRYSYLPVSPTAYVANFGDNTVTPIDTATKATGSPITVGGSPIAIAINPVGSTAYVADLTGNAVTPINTSTDTAGTPIAVGNSPDAIAITPDGTTAYVTNNGDGTVTPINTATDTAGTPIRVGTWPDAIAITPDGTTAYVANNADDTVTPINTATDTAGTPIAVGSEPIAIAITPDGTTAYVTNNGDDTVTPIDTATNIAGNPITVGSAPAAIAIAPDGSTAYVANQGASTVTPITLPATAGPPIAVGHSPRAIAITPDGSAAYVANQGTSTVTPIDTATKATGRAITVGSGPIAIAITYVTPGPATHFSVTAPASATAGTPFNLTVTALDANGNTATGYLGTVTFTSSDGAAVLPPGYTFVGRDKGVHTFSSHATFHTAGSQTITATDSVNPSITGTSGPINVTPGPATHFSRHRPGQRHRRNPFQPHRHRPRRQRQHRHRLPGHRDLHQL